MAEPWRNSSASAETINKKLGGKLDAMAKRLAAGRRCSPRGRPSRWNFFEAILPLLADQQRFVQLALWQRDLAERLASLKGKEGKDNPALKARIATWSRSKGRSARPWASCWTTSRSTARSCPTSRS